MSDIWCAELPGILLSRRWGDHDSVVVYHPGSGHTHLLEPLAAEVLDELQLAPCSVEHLDMSLHDRVDASDRPALREHIEAALLQLQKYALVRHII